MIQNINSQWAETENTTPTKSELPLIKSDAPNTTIEIPKNCEKSECNGIGYTKNVTRSQKFSKSYERKPWSLGEDEWLKKNIKTVSGTDCAKYLERSLDAIYARCFNIGIQIREKRTHNDSIMAICIDCNIEKTILNFRFRAGRDYYEKRCKQCEDIFSIRDIPKSEKDTIIDLYFQGYNLHDIENQTGFKNSHKIALVIQQSGIVRTNVGVLTSRAIAKYKGKKFGFLTPLERSEIKDEPSVYEWFCKCDCGKTTTVRQHVLHQGKTQSCGDIEHYIGNKNKHWRGHRELPQAYFYRVERGAKERNLEFNITIEYAWEVFLTQEGLCRFSGELLTFKKESKSRNGTASLDRIDSTKGYIKGNIQWVRKDINVLKRAKNDQDFIDLCIKIAKHCQTE